MTYKKIILDTQILFSRSETESYPKDIREIKDSFVNALKKAGEVSWGEARVLFLFREPSYLQAGVSDGERKFKANVLPILTQILKSYSDNFVYALTNQEPMALGRVFSTESHDKTLIITDSLEFAPYLLKRIKIYDTQKFWHLTNFRQKYLFEPSAENIQFYRALDFNLVDRSISKLKDIPLVDKSQIVLQFRTLKNLISNFSGIQNMSLGANTILSLYKNLDLLKTNLSALSYSSPNSYYKEKACRRCHSEAFFWFKALGLPPEVWMLPHKTSKTKCERPALF